MSDWLMIIQAAGSLFTFAATLVNFLAALRGRRGDVDR